MRLNILHRVNPIGESLVNYFENSWEKVNFHEFIMEGCAYFDITAEQGLSNINFNINRARAFMNSVNNEVIEEILALNGIAANLSTGDIINKSYDFLIWDRTILSIRQITYGKSTVNKKYIDEKQIIKIADIAKRAMYLLGLDYAMISISINRQRKIRAAGVDASPAIRDKDLFNIISKTQIYFYLRLSEGRLFDFPPKNR